MTDERTFRHYVCDRHVQFQHVSHKKNNTPATCLFQLLVKIRDRKVYAMDCWEVFFHTIMVFRKSKTDLEPVVDFMIENVSMY